MNTKEIDEVARSLTESSGRVRLDADSAETVTVSIGTNGAAKIQLSDGDGETIDERVFGIARSDFSGIDTSARYESDIFKVAKRVGETLAETEFGETVNFDFTWHIDDEPDHWDYWVQCLVREGGPSS
jgi:hypothetical protein